MHDIAPHHTIIKKAPDLLQDRAPSCAIAPTPGGDIPATLELSDLQAGGQRWPEHDALHVLLH